MVNEVFDGDIKTKGNSNKGKELALMAFTIHRFIAIMSNEIERSGFVNIEFLEKMQYFLKATTQKFPEKHFKEVLEILESVDPNFPKTEFFYGLCALRALNSGDAIRIKTYLSPQVEETLNAELIFFSIFLIENVLNYIISLRSDPNMKRQTLEDYKRYIDNKFDDIVLRTVTTILQNSAVN